MEIAVHQSPAQIERQYAAAFPTSIWRSPIRLAGWLAVLSFAAFAAQRLDLLNFERLSSGASRLFHLIGLMFPPTAGGRFDSFVMALLETLSMALLGTLLAAVVALPLAFMLARNTMPFAFLRGIVRAILNILRGVDNLIFALIFVSAVGLGPFAGVLAIAVGTIGSLGKLIGETIENLDPKPSEGVRASGANYLQNIRFGILPQILPDIGSLLLYYFESNTRSATILGVVGAGGIGLQLSDRIRIHDWPEVCALVMIIVATAIMIDLASSWLRSQLIGRKR